MPQAPSYRKVNPADQPILLLSLSSKTLPLYAGGRVRRDAPGADHLAGARRRTGPSHRLAEVRGARPGGSGESSPRLGSGSTRSPPRSASNVNLPTGTLYGPRKAFAIEADGQLENAQAYRRSSSPTETARRFASRTSAARSTASRTTRRRRGATAPRARSAPSCSPCRSSPAPTRSRWRARSSSLLPRFRAGDSRRRLARRALRSLAHRQGVRARRGAHARVHVRAGRDGDLRLFATRRRDHHSEPLDAARGAGDLRRDVPARAIR